MMIGEKYYSNQTVHVAPWPYRDDLTVDVHSALITSNGNGNSNDDFSSLQNDAALKALMRYLPSNSNDVVFESDNERDVDLPVGAYSSDNFRMYDFKVRRCARGRSHDWTECPYAHPGEKARRRDPRKFHYSGTACPEFRKGSCRKGDACEYAHGVFECWLHPARYRTQPCKDGLSCRRRVCFFAHAPEQLRVLSPRAESPHWYNSYDGSCESGSPPTESPPLSPSVNSLSRSHGSNSVNGLVASMRQIQLNKVNSMPSSWKAQIGSPRLGSTRARPGFCSLPATPTQSVGRPGSCYFDLWERSLGKEEAPMERVESGRDLRAKMFERIGKENPLDGENPSPNPYPTQADDSNPDFGWVSDLVQ